MDTKPRDLSHPTVRSPWTCTRCGAVVSDGVPCRSCTQARESEGPTYSKPRDLSHLDALTERLSHEKARLASAKSEHERALRTVWVSQCEKEIAAEYKHLGIDPLPPSEISNEDLAAMLTDLEDTLAAPAPQVLRCAMEKDCTAEVTHADHKGYVYCATHGVERKRSGIRCRKLTKTEIRKLAASEPITY